MTGMGTVTFIPVHIEYEVPGVDYLGSAGRLMVASLSGTGAVCVNRHLPFTGKQVFPAETS